MSCGGFPGRSVRAHGPASGDDDPMLSYRVTNSAAGCRRCAPPQQIALRSSTLLRFRCLRALGPRKCKVPAGILERRVERERLLELLDGFVKPAERGERDAEIVAGLDGLRRELEHGAEVLDGVDEFSRFEERRRRCVAGADRFFDGRF